MHRRFFYEREFEVQQLYGYVDENLANFQGSEIEKRPIYVDAALLEEKRRRREERARKEEVLDVLCEEERLREQKA